MQANELEVQLRSRLEQSPHSAAAMNNYGAFLRQQGRYAESEALLQDAFRVRPDSVEICFNLALVLVDLGRFDEAEVAVRRACALKPDFADAHGVLGDVLSKQARWAESEKVFREAISIKPHDANLYSALGNVLRLQRRLPEAEAVLKHALTLDPNSFQTHQTLGIVLDSQERVEEAEAATRRSLAIRPDNAPAKLSLGFILLRSGQYAEGWTRFETRLDTHRSTDWDSDNFDLAPAAAPSFSIVRWRHGEPIARKSLLVVQEEGLGDVIQFARFLPMLKARGVSRLSVLCSPNLARLLECVDGVDEVIPSTQGIDVASYDRWCFMMSLPHRLDITLANLPADVPYFRLPDAQVTRWSKTFAQRAPSRSPKVGLVWGGSHRLGCARPGRFDTTENEQRSIALSSLIDCLAIPGIEFFSLQMGGPEAELTQIPPHLRPVDLMSGVTDLADTAALIEQLDLVISVDTSVAHLAGALGKPVWILCRFAGDWRWLVGRDDSPWYPSARLFRQSRPDDWTDVIAKVGQCLRELARSEAPPR
ncbi:tetratricopeptide repeat protein [Caballeronia sp. Sq4a]|uniref:tetratricopeptide repeat-containing glycosyltransferase family protein n=1 Tax=Caballeronia sp. Sq4a TaxID=2878152 RepID=UPI0020C106C7|nr:tetratricopeptide repeat-containing glycosyltransferase family protein [Caballeronia sp. Sq4a]